MKVPFIYFLSIFLCFSCNKELKKNKLKSSIINPLDTILGDKAVDNKITRQDNFKCLTDLDKKWLFQKSEHYLIQQIDTNLFLLKQKKNYIDARNFSALIQTKSSKMYLYKVFNDFIITDVKKDTENWIVLLSDFDNRNDFWKSKQQISVLKLDNQLNEIWKYNAESINYPLVGRKLTVNKKAYSILVDVITGCHICLVYAYIEMSKEGKVILVKQTGSTNSGYISDNTLQKLFKN